MAVQGEQENRHWLVEYNTIQRAGDFINMDGTFHIIRNNFIHDYSDSYWTAGAGHPDVFQPFNITNHVYEANVSGDSRSGHSHWLQIRDPGTNVIFRGNIGYNFGSYALQAGAVDHVVMYHNTFHDLGNISTGNPFGYNAENGNPSLDNHFFNNIVHTATGNVLLSPSGGSTVSASHNIGYRAPSHASVISTSDPLLVNPAGRRFELQGTSPAINAGRAITTITSPSGSGNSFNVSNPKFFCDGWGITGGDLINVGANPPVRITRVANNTITTDAPVTWTTGTEVYWRTQDGRPDIGGYEFRSGGYTFGVALISPSQGTVVSGPTTLTASVSNPECVRFVMFYANGVPVAQAMKAPYTASWVPREEGAVNLEARAYALYAGTNSVQTARITVNANADGIQRPAPPSNLRVVTQ